MNIALWIAQGILAVVFAASGVAKGTQTKERLIASGQTGVVFFPLPAIRVIAALELLGAIGIIVPWATGIAPILTPLAAIGFALLMVGAGISHTRLREPRAVVINALFLVVSLFVAYGRLGDLIN